MEAQSTKSGVQGSIKGGWQEFGNLQEFRYQVPYGIYPVFIFGSCFCIVFFIMTEKDIGGVVCGLALMILIASLALRMHLKRSYNYLIYYNIFSGQPALVFWRNKPDKQTFSNFIDQFNNQLSEQNVGYAAQEAGMASEIRKLHELLEKGILSEEEYKAGKAKILGAEGDDWKY
ncbi:MAG: SHOCT domain-containing protein [Sedimentisphaerales bacterium]